MTSTVVGTAVKPVWRRLRADSSALSRLLSARMSILPALILRAMAWPMLRHGVYLTLCIFCVISSGYTYTLHKANKYLIVHGGIRDKMGTPVNGIGVLLSTNGLVLATENICLAVAFWS